MSNKPNLRNGKRVKKAVGKYFTRKVQQVIHSREDRPDKLIMSVRTMTVLKLENFIPLNKKVDFISKIKVHIKEDEPGHWLEGFWNDDEKED